MDTGWNKPEKNCFGLIKTLETAPADLLDRSNAYMDLALELKNLERHSDMIVQVDRALARIDDGSFGY